MLFWQTNLKKSHQKDSIGQLTCPKCLLKHSPDYNYDSSVTVCGRVEIGYDLQTESIYKKCDRCNHTEILESNVQNDVQEFIEGGEDDEVDVGGTEKVYPLFSMTLDQGRNYGSSREPSHLDSNRGLDPGTINEIAAAFSTPPNSGGPTFNERLAWGQRDRSRYDHL